jgi:serine/threonine protein kinase
MLLKIGRHPRVVRFLGKYVDGEDQLLITEFAPLWSLTDACETMGDKFTLAHSVVMMQQIAQVMAHFASEGIIHRDLAARNVLVFVFDENNVPTTSVKLSDYGMAVGSYNTIARMSHLHRETSPFAICRRRRCRRPGSPRRATCGRLAWCAGRF